MEFLIDFPKIKIFLTNLSNFQEISRSLSEKNQEIFTREEIVKSPILDFALKRKKHFVQI